MNNNNKENLKSKHILFFSNFCQFSNDILKMIEKNNIKNQFILINISQKKYKIPLIITTVPTILLNDKKTIIQDDNLDKFLDNLSKKNQNIDPFTNIKGISNEYSFLDDDNNVNSTLNFGLINREEHIVTPPEDGNSATSVSINDKINNMQEQRNIDIQNFFNKNV